MKRVALLVCGKRKAGKDYCSALLCDLLRVRHAVSIVGVSHSLKKEYALSHGLNYDELLSSGSYKEKYRKEMIVWGEEVRAKDPGYFCSAAVKDVDANIFIVSDCRRPSDIIYFQQHFRTLVIRIESSMETRKCRGFVFTEGVDDVASECALDDWKYDFVVNNDCCSTELTNQLGNMVNNVELL